MAPRRVSDFLHWAEKYHQRLADFYCDRGEDAARPEMKTLLAYMARHQESLRKVIQDYERGASKAVLDTWYKASPDPKAFKNPEAAGFRPNMTTSEVIELALDLDKSLLTMYEILIRNAESQGLREMLQNLLQEERREEVKLMRSQSSA